MSDEEYPPYEPIVTANHALIRVCRTMEGNAWPVEGFDDGCIYCDCTPRTYIAVDALTSPPAIAAAERVYEDWDPYLSDMAKDVIRAALTVASGDNQNTGDPS